MAYKSVSVGVTNTSSIVLTAPNNVTVNDMLISWVTGGATFTVTWPAGFTEFFDDQETQSGSQTFAIAYKPVTQTEPSTYTITFSANAFATAGIAAFSNRADRLPTYILTTQPATMPSGGTTYITTSNGITVGTTISSDLACIGDMWYGFGPTAVFSGPPGFTTQANTSTTYAASGLTTLDSFYGSTGVLNGTMTFSTVPTDSPGYALVLLALPVRISLRLTNTGTLYTNGQFDEITKTAFGMDASNVYAPNVGGFDEVTSTIVNDSSLLLNLNASVNQYYIESTSTWYDISNNQYKFTLAGTSATTYTTGNPSYYTFNGPTGSGYFTTPTNFANGLPNMTVAAWVRTSISYNTSYFPPIVSKINDQGSASASPGWVFQIYPASGNIYRLAFYIQTNGQTAYYARIANAAVTVDGNWHYVAATLSGGIGGTILLYQDGNLITADPATAGTVTTYATSTPVLIGSDLAGLHGRWQGDIGGVQIYNRALSAAEILTNYLANVGDYIANSTSTAMSVRTSTVYISQILDEVTGAV